MQKASDFNIRDAKVRPQKYYYQEENFMRKNHFRDIKKLPSAITYLLPSTYKKLKHDKSLVLVRIYTSFAHRTLNKFFDLGTEKVREVWLNSEIFSGSLHLAK